jgi:xanthine dehydrogenase YagS FAD-binding subunit
MKAFEYVAPGSVRDAAGMLSDTWGKSEVLAGGTDLLTCLKQHLTMPDRVVSLKNIAALRGIKVDGNTVHVGATTTLAELAGNAAIRKHFPALVTAAEGVGSPQMMSMGTVGGDLCQRPRCWYFRNGLGRFPNEEGVSLLRQGDNRYAAVFGTDGPALFVSASSLGPVLNALGAAITAEGPNGQIRTIPAADFFQTPKNETERETVLKPNEILTGIEIPLKGLKNATYEIRHRRGLDWPYVTATVVFQLQGASTSDARVVLGHVAAVPWLASAAADILNGARIDEGTAAKCGQAAATGAKPLSQNAYKVPLIKAAVKRAALEAAKA